MCYHDSRYSDKNPYVFFYGGKLFYVINDKVRLCSRKSHNFIETLNDETNYEFRAKHGWCDIKVDNCAEDLC